MSFKEGEQEMEQKREHRIPIGRWSKTKEYIIIIRWKIYSGLILMD
jgi:hypothetical protein